MKIRPNAAAVLLVMTAAAFARADLPAPRVNITERDGYRYIESNGIPDHQPGQFPNRGNPNTIAAQQHKYRVPLNPRPADRITPLRRQPFGVAINGVPFDPGTAEFWNNDPDSGWIYEAKSGKINLGLDDSNAHVQPGGSYHYHGLPLGLIKALGGGTRMMRVGYAADGFPIYAKYGYADAKNPGSELKELKSSYRVRKGQRSGGPRGAYDGAFVADYEYIEGAGDLDECNGRTGITPDYPGGTYYYVITDDFPFIPRAFRGTPDPSFERRGMGGRGGPPPGGRRPPPPRPGPR